MYGQLRKCGMKRALYMTRYLRYCKSILFDRHSIMSLGFSWVFTRTTSFKGTFGKYEWSHQHALRKKKNQQNRYTWGLKGIQRFLIIF